MKNIVLFGPPGAGKGTQAALLVARYGFNHISTGEIIRDEIRRATPLGHSMEEYIARGELAPDELVIDMVAEYVADHRDVPGNIFDGFPRTMPQAQELDAIMALQGLSVNAMILLDVPEDELVKRLLERGLTSGRADDSSEEVIRNRIGIYRRQTAPVAEYYSGQGKLHVVHGKGTIREIAALMAEVVESL